MKAPKDKAVGYAVVIVLCAAGGTLCGTMQSETMRLRLLKEDTMHLARWIAAFGVWMAVGGATVAAPCAGFTDVADTSGFCPNVEWLKNRQITLGCTSPTLY